MKKMFTIKVKLSDSNDTKYLPELPLHNFKNKKELLVLRNRLKYFVSTKNLYNKPLFLWLHRNKLYIWQ